MQDVPFVSIVMPLYNKRPYVRRAIDSVRAQSFTDWELIVIDDGSTDGSTDEIPRDEQRIRIFRQPNAGPSAARNRGIRVASGTFLTFIDADNYYYPHKLEQEMTFLEKESMVSWMVSTYNYETKDGVKLRKICDIHGNDLTGQPVVYNNATTQLTIRDWHIDGLCIRTDVLRRLNGFREDMRCYEITEFYIRCALLEPKVTINPDPLFCVVDVPDSAFKDSSHRIDGMRKMGESLYDLSNQYPQFSDYLVRRGRRAMLSHVAGLICKGEDIQAKDFLVNVYPYHKDVRWLIKRIYVGLPIFARRIICRNSFYPKHPR